MKNNTVYKEVIFTKRLYYTYLIYKMQKQMQKHSKKHMTMKLLHVEEHISCSHYMPSGEAGFRYIEMSQGTFLDHEIASYNYLIFVMAGSLEISGETFTREKVRGGEFFFVVKNCYCSGRILEDANVMVCKYDHLKNLCDKFTFMKLASFKKERFEFAPLPVKEVLAKFLELMTIYLQAGGNCVHLHAIKQEELLWVLRATYEKEELAALFYPVIGRSLNFRDKVMSNYKSAGTAQQLARLCGYSRQQFNKLFMVEFGESPFLWMQKRLMLHIKTRLADEDIPLGDIVEEFGLSSLSHFIRLCKKHFGKTPAELRVELIEEQLNPYKFKVL